MKPKLTLDEMVSRIESGDHFEAETRDGSIYLKIEDDAPFAGFAIHNGHRLRTDLQKKCLLNDYERWYEEDPDTLTFISSLPIILSCNDSRYEYDLNRGVESAIYDVAWGKNLWKTPLTSKQKDVSHQKHENFYRVLHALVARLEKKYGAVIAFDIHSYNYQRIEKECPVFNLGTERINKRKYRKYINYFLEELSGIELPNIEVDARENVVFFGRGYLVEYINKNFKNVLVIATEIKKIYCNELTGESFPVIIEKLSNQLKKAIVNTSALFTREKTNLSIRRNNSLLSSELEKELLIIDKKLFELARDFEILKYTNPVNIEQARKEFFRSRFRKNPEFVYRQLSLNPFEFKRKLYQLKVENISDISIRLLYQSVIDSYADKVEIINSIGTHKFLYNSLRYFGEPSSRDIRNAEYILHLSSSIDRDETESYGPGDALEYFTKIVDEYGFDCKIEISRKVVSKILIINSRNTIRIRKDSTFSEKSLKALSEHEIGVHMLTTANSRVQPLNVFRLGTPVNSHTQEGLAVLSEYLSGNMSIKRLQVFALRVLCISKMLDGYDFRQCFEYLMEQRNMDENQAFYFAARIFRGGGFTKDYLYLRGFRDIFHLYNSGKNLNNLLIGKTSIDFLNVINEMIERKIILPPKYITRSFIKPSEPNEIIDYILKGVR
jgi:uncharacterized protein (TIGR02421 family)